MDIPETIDGAVNELTGIGGLLMAKQWERAAIVYAFTHEHQQGQNTCSSCREHDMKTVSGFAAIGIKGLTTREGVALYRNNWQWAIDNGHADGVHPGSTSVRIPEADWPGIESRDNQHRVQRMEPKKLADDIASREDADEVIKGLMSTASGRKALRLTIAENEDMVRAINRRHEVVAPPKPAKIRLALDDWELWEDAQRAEFDEATVKAVRQILNAALLRQRGYQASADAEIHLDLVRPADIDADYEQLVAEVLG